MIKYKTKLHLLKVESTNITWTDMVSKILGEVYLMTIKQQKHMYD